jgi:uncharacterized protein
MTQFDFPFHFDDTGRTATTDHDAHIRNLIEQVLFTSPGERVNRPTFGSGLMQLVFAPNSEQLTSAAQFTVQSALQQWLGDLIQVESVQVQSMDATLRITVDYIVRRSQGRRVAEFTREGVVG